MNYHSLENTLFYYHIHSKIHFENTKTENTNLYFLNTIFAEKYKLFTKNSKFVFKRIIIKSPLKNAKFPPNIFPPKKNNNDDLMIFERLFFLIQKNRFFCQKIIRNRLYFSGELFSMFFH